MSRSKDDRAISEMKTELFAIENGSELNFLDKYITLIYPQRVSLLDYFGDKSTVFIRNTTETNRYRQDVSEDR